MTGYGSASCRSPLFFQACRKGTSISCNQVVNRHRTETTTGMRQGKLRVGGMGKVTVTLIIVIALLLFGGAAFLALWNPPVPSSPVEKVIPDARFPK